MCKAAALTKRIRGGASVKLIHLAHPVDIAIQAAVTITWSATTASSSASARVFPDRCSPASASQP